MSVQSSQSRDEVVLRHPGAEDGNQLWEITKRSETLDLNSPYHYLLMCRHFAASSVVAEVNGRIAGFVTAYIPPESSDTLFVWQVAVDRKFRGQGLARKMLAFAFHHPQRPLSYLEATITPSNTASICLFTAAAQDLDAPFAFNETFFSQKNFGSAEHECEMLFRIGPIGL
ncbi:L-2,4-diaminobutyric acid acetyltransferase [Desulfoluna limicola]|uniref:L-2,4-diaminobutyric acid acetyltransferase n=1 Tax=Desulfoluna limicola TaxID=2810562 RepID=A0ABN6F4J3_9BACT|nr:diaminobutyrate acetyltransferase [Desulfoluna limicola]BCS97004.1 L-2,4-diaminobutyric acid acetyltransferase [Desulfoluna limicola]